MIRSAQTLFLLVVALGLGLVKVGLFPRCVENVLIEARAGRVYNVIHDVGTMHRDLAKWQSWPANLWPKELDGLTQDIRSLDLEIEDRFRWWKATGDETWVPALQERVQQLSIRTAAARRAADTNRAGR